MAEAGTRAGAFRAHDAHRAENTAPLSLIRAGVTWWATPPPTQGAALLAVLGHDGDPLTAARQSELSRDALLGDPRTGPIDTAGLLLRTPRDLAALAPGPRPTGDTVAVTAVDDEGNAVSLIQSVSQSLSSGIADSATGVVLHRRAPAQPGLWVQPRPGPPRSAASRWDKVPRPPRIRGRRPRRPRTAAALDTVPGGPS